MWTTVIGVALHPEFVRDYEAIAVRIRQLRRQAKGSLTGENIPRNYQCPWEERQKYLRGGGGKQSPQVR